MEQTISKNMFCEVILRGNVYIWLKNQNPCEQMIRPALFMQIGALGGVFKTKSF